MKRQSTEIMIVAAEPSADLHGSRLVEEIRQQRSDLSFFGIGGPKMAHTGVELICRMEELAVVGFSEVFGKLALLRRVFSQTVSLLRKRRPALLILIDYPGFNLLLARKAKRLGIPVMYYIAPQVWAWWPSRARRIARWVAKVAVIFPFETPLFTRCGADVEFVGHPLLDVVKSELTKSEFCQKWQLSPHSPLIGILPGSRKQEVEKILPVMIETANIINRSNAGFQVMVSRVKQVELSLYRQIIDGIGIKVKIAAGCPYEMMAHADLLLVASGTATLEAAILGTPMLIIYKVTPLSYLIGKMVAKVSSIGLVNIVAGKRIVPEFVQHQATPERVAAEALNILHDRDRARTIRQQLAEVKQRLGAGGAARRAAQIALGMLPAE